MFNALTSLENHHDEIMPFTYSKRMNNSLQTQQDECAQERYSAEILTTASSFPIPYLAFIVPKMSAGLIWGTARTGTTRNTAHHVAAAHRRHNTAATVVLWRRMSRTPIRRALLLVTVLLTPNTMRYTLEARRWQLYIHACLF